jgi:pyruvyltransferase
VGIALKYWTDAHNAGDIFSKYIVERYIGPVTAHANENRYGSLNLMCVGSLLRWSDHDTVICGSGLLSPDIPPRELPRHIISVRGPHTRSELMKLGAEVPTRYGDPGILASEFVDLSAAETHEYGIVLHHQHKKFTRCFYNSWLIRRDDTIYIDIQSDPLDVLNKMQRCRVILSSSLHGLIFAHALGKRAVWISCNGWIGGKFKFYDYFASLGIADPTIEPVPVDRRADLKYLSTLATHIDVTKLQDEVRHCLSLTKEYFEIQQLYAA